VNFYTSENHKNWEIPSERMHVIVVIKSVSLVSFHVSYDVFCETSHENDKIMHILANFEKIYANSENHKNWDILSETMHDIVATKSVGYVSFGVPYEFFSLYITWKCRNSAHFCQFLNLYGNSANHTN